jgi:NADPH2:quinone reductase
LARHLGARVIAASRGTKLVACREAGAEALIDYEAEDLKEAARKAASTGVDVVIDPVGGRWAEPALRAMNRGGRFVTIGYTDGEIPKVPLNLVLLKGISIHGFAMGSFAADHPELAKRDRAEVMALFSQRKVGAHVSAVYPLERTVEALQRVARREATGKVVILCRPESSRSAS